MQRTTWKSFGVVFPLLVALVAAAACERTEVRATGEAEAADEQINAVQAALAIDDVAIGGALDEEGSIELGGNNGDFAPGDPIYVAMEVGDAAPGTEVRVDWFGPSERQIESDAKNVAEGDRYLNFQAPETTGWPGGEYRAEVWYANERVDEMRFRIQAPDAEVQGEGAVTAATSAAGGVQREAGDSGGEDAAEARAETGPGPRAESAAGIGTEGE